MGRRKIIRTKDEEEQVLESKRKRQAEYQKKYREKKKESEQSQDNFSFPSTSRNEPNSSLNAHSHSPHSLIIKNVYCKSSVMTRCITTSTITSSVSHLKTLSESLTSETVNQNKENKFTQSSQILNVSKPPFNPINSQNESNITNSSFKMTQKENQSKIRLQNFRANKRGFENIDINSLTEHYAGPMNVVCVNCDAKHFQAERISNKGNSFSDCCSHGKVKLEKLPHLPDELKKLFAGNHFKSIQFFKNIRAYNNAFSFASFNANLIDLQGQRRGPYCFKIQGQIYYQINTSLYPSTNEQASYGQLFILDSNEATECRLKHNSNLDDDILQLLDKIIRENNIFAQSYQMMHEEVRNHQEQLGTDIPNLEMKFLQHKTGVHAKRFNAQRVNEVAAIFSTIADGDIPEFYVTIRNKHDKKLQSVSALDPNVEPWIYPLYYPFGTQGWHKEMKQVNGKRITRLMYVQSRIAVRDNEENVILKGRRLFQQWLVDSYVKIEKDRIDWCKQNQKQLRVENYQGLIDYLQTNAANTDANVGRVMILPSSFIGSPRNMMQNYQDAMAIVRKYGKPDIFLTMTCNPNWPEIQENLLPGQQSADRPDICARVFEVKVKFLKDLIVRQQFFGEIKAFVYVIEFQKRGLPHIHMLLTLKQNHKITTPDTVDKYISAEIPNPDTNKKLHDIVIKNMIHGPCGDWCLINGKCSKNFPKSFHSETTMDENGYSQYQRRDTGILYEKSGHFSFDNRYVVPYCPTLSVIFNCHINVEIVSSIKSVKYLYKYIYKGHDSATIVIGDGTSGKELNHDEIKAFVEARYVGPVEACWRILSKSLQEKSHSIMRLPVHLPNGQNVIICDNANQDEILSALDRVTMLLDYFNLNKRDISARQYYYSEIPVHYVFKKVNIDGKQIHRWEKRKANFNCIGRIYSVSPSQTELFHLRTLLLNVKGTTSFEDIRTVNGVMYQTYADACLALGLIEDDNEWERAMREATNWMMPRQIRNLFVRILIHCSPIHPKDLWDEFKISMSEDYIRRFSQVIGIRKAYAQIDQLLHKEGWSLARFPEMDQIKAEFEQEDAEQLQKEAVKGREQYDMLNADQKIIVDYILNILENQDNASKYVYVDGPGGSGKTFVYTTLYHLLKSQNKVVHTMAFTGIAATLLPNGKTVHKSLGLPVPLFSDSTSNIKMQSKEAQYLKSVDVFIWDEAPMAPRYALEIMDKLLKEIMQNDFLFGGKIVILGGDFRQLLPVLQRGTRLETVSLSLKFSALWNKFKIFSLSQNMRVLPKEREFAQFLLNLGDGLLNDSNDNIEIPSLCIADKTTNIVDDTYKQIINKKDFKSAAKYAILSARNVDVEEINQQVVNLLDEETEKMYTSVDSVEVTGDHLDINEAILPEYLNTLNPPSLPPHELRLRKYTVVMLIRNLSINEGLCNGTRLLVLNLGNNILECEILNGDKAGEKVFLHRITLICENIYPFVFRRRQFPVKVAFAMTINKSQGQTFDKIAIDLRKNVFNHGQLYVAFSRVRSFNTLKVYLEKDTLTQSVKNYVYKEIYN